MKKNTLLALVALSVFILLAGSLGFFLIKKSGETRSRKEAVSLVEEVNTSEAAKGAGVAEVFKSSARPVTDLSTEEGKAQHKENIRLFDAKLAALQPTLDELAKRFSTAK
jgi:hypothetical protein